MKRRFLLALTFGLLVACVRWGWAVEPNEEQAKAVAEIKKLGGGVTVDEKNPDKPVICVDFSDTNVTDAGLELLKGLPELQRLDLSCTTVTNAGLENSRG